MAIRAKKLILYLRFDIGGWNGLGHATRSIELAKELKKKFNVIICTNKLAKNFIKQKNFKYIYKKEKEKEERFLERVSELKKNPIIFIDNNYEYKKKFLRKLNYKYKKIFFYQNFSSGIQKENIIFNPTPELNQSIRINKKFKVNKIYSGDKYLIIPKSIYYNKKKYLGISFGASDPKNISLKLLKFLIKIKWKFPTFLFTGELSAFQKKIKKIKLPKNIRITKFDKKKLLKSCLAICSPGITAFELLNNYIFGIYISHSKKHNNLGNYIEEKYKFSKNINIYYKKKLIVLSSNLN